ncbi:MAG: hypothetical protein KDK48_06250, partial [Chlamydiia bacterium]|nr:hypothetical protein [Chlamydiia bacterium]
MRFDWTPKAKVPSKSAEEFFTVRGKTNPRILFHIHGDMFGDNSELQGSHHEKTYGYLVDYLKNSRRFKLDSAFLRKLKEAHRLTQSPNFSKDAEALTRSAFSKGESVLIPGGWMGKPVGHAVNFELIPEKDGTCTLRIYNLGAGTEHSGVVAEDGKLRGPCYSEWKGIERERATSPLFFRAIGEMIGFEKAALGQNYSEGDLFGRLKHHLQPAEEIAGVSAPHMSLQQSGVCAWRSLMAVMRTHMPENEYKRFVIQIKLASLKEHCAALIDKEWEKMPREAQNVEYGLITESAKKLARTLAKGVESGTITANFAAKEQKEIAALLSKMESRGMKIPSPFDKPLFTPAGETAPEETPLDTRPLSIKPQSAKATSVDLTPKVERTSSIAACDITDARGLDMLIKACKGADYDDVHVGITDAVKNANLHAFKETTATPEEAQELIIKLGQVSDTYLRSCYCIEGADKIHTDIVYVLRKIAYFQSALSKQAGFEVGYHRGNSFASPLHERFYDPKMRKEMAEMNSSKAVNISPFDREDEDALLKNTLYQDGFEGSVFQNYEEFLARNHPEAIKAALRKNPSIGSYNRMARSVALFYSSEGPEWFRALRDSGLNCD